ncbi:MAG TPA: HAMP domain-containing sensor histidine kinase [Baekduia sp.]|nr:HAMP domain-containing sensor histidine kinase [Baekduia sp.]
MTLRRRLVVAAAAAVALAVVASTVIVYVTTRAELRAQVDDSLREMAPDVRFETPAARLGLVRRLLVPRDPLGGPSGVAQLVLPTGDVVRAAGAAALPDDPRALEVAAGLREPFFEDATVDGTHARVLTTRGPGGEALQVARPLTEVDDALGRLRLVLGLVAVAGVGLAAALGALVARTALGPVARLTDAAEDLADTRDLRRRLPGGGRDEVSRLGASFNRLLTALQRSREAQRQLVADASHELRTPLTSVRANVEVLARRPDLPAAERERVVAAARAQIEELSVLVGDLVDLARQDEAPPPEALEDVRLDMLVGDAVRRARLHAPACEFRLHVEQPVLVRGVPGQLHRAVSNLLDNAVKHGPPAGPVEVRVGPAGVAVRDHGPGIAPDEVPHVFDRFHRGVAARGLPGSGLGLAIVRQVAELHGGGACAAAAPGGGARLELHLPTASAVS